MEKDILKTKRDELIKLKEEYETNNKEIELKENENEDLDAKYIEINKKLAELENSIYFLRLSKKIAKNGLVIAIFASIIVLSVGLIKEMAFLRNFIISLFTFVGISTISSLFYLNDKSIIKGLGCKSLEECMKQINDYDNEKQLINSKHNCNEKRIKSLEIRNENINNEIHKIILEVMKNNDICEKLMTKVIESNKSEKIVEVIADTILEETNGFQKIKK